MNHLCFLILLAAILLNSQRSQAFAQKQSDGFVKTRGFQLTVDGNPYYANGFNAYWLMYMATDPSQRFRVSVAFQEAAKRGLTLARTWAFNDGGYRALQSSPGSYNEPTFQGLDFVIAEARRYGIKLILSLVNNNDDYGGKKQYVKWAKDQGQSLTSDDDFFTNPLVKTYYKNHVKTVINRYNTFTKVYYKDDPTIMAWELINEPRCSSDPSGRTIQTWIMEMASYVKCINRRHLLEVGLEGFYGQSTPHRKSLNPSFDSGTDFIANNQIPDIDFVTVHSYPDQWLSRPDDQTQQSFLNSWLTSHIEDAQSILRKPILITEFGKSSKDSGFNTYKRDLMFNTVYSKIYASAKTGGAAAGGLFWQLLSQGMSRSFQDGYGLILSQGSSTSNIITRESYKLVRIRRFFARKRNLPEVQTDRSY